MEIPFVKMEGLGNDFVIMDDRQGGIRKEISCSDLAKRLCDRHFGIGGDGIILAGESRDHDIEFIIFNSDGSEAQMCGNGMRCFAKFLFERQILPGTRFRVATRAGTIEPEVLTDEHGRVVSVKVDMGEPVLKPELIPFVPSSPCEIAMEEKIDLEGSQMTATIVSMGNPHTVVFTEDLSSSDVERTGRAVENHSQFPEKTNVEFIEVLNDRELKMKVWERGVGITLACGTGACASLVASNLTGRTGNRAVVHLDGGDLEIFWDRENTGRVYKTGPAVQVFEGRINI
ncbi:diaminopimelate epimerase [Desulfospira joergensenii]|uniref:diaminopimelate epimerase n=1 Tax=Desulfospira joergensenii TaxID=53329 RepID=UPI0003B54255|nr:diaminopimelate epimerase [Desulfospira joergensenii]